MIVDDSAIARSVLARMISAHADLEVVALAANADEALDALKTVSVDIVLLDVEMPGTNGIDALPEILRRGEGARVLIVSCNCEEGADVTIRALALGAADTLPKPGTGAFGGRFSEVLAERLRKIGRARGRAGPAPTAGIRLRATPADPPRCIAIGASTGGLHAISEFMATLPRAVSAPVLVTQHLPPVFMASFARQIESASGRPTRVAEAGLPLRTGEIIVAPGDAHLCLERSGASNVVALSREPTPSGCMPSVDPMLSSVASIYGGSALAVILSGMGRDGLAGSRHIAERGGAVLVQNRESSSVWGMPRAVAEAGLASAILAPAELARRVGSRSGMASCR